MGDSTKEQIEDCVARPFCFLMKFFLSILTLGTSFYILKDPAKSVSKGRLSGCTQMPLICAVWFLFFFIYIIFYFLLTCYNLGQRRENIDICCCSPVPKFLTLIFIAISIWTFYDFFHIDGECKSYIQAEGSSQFWLACQVLTYSLAVLYIVIVLLICVVLPCWLFCCFMTEVNGFFTGMSDQSRREIGPAPSEPLLSEV